MGVRQAKIEDLHEILRLLYQLSPLKNEQEDISKLRQILKSMIEDKDYDLVVFEEDDALLGTAALVTLKNLTHGGKGCARIENVVTNEASRGKGVGKQLVLHLLELGKKKNLYKIILDCEKHNIPFYERCGLSLTGEVEMRVNT